VIQAEGRGYVQCRFELVSPNGCRGRTTMPVHASPRMQEAVLGALRAYLASSIRLLSEGSPHVFVPALSRGSSPNHRPQRTRQDRHASCPARVHTVLASHSSHPRLRRATSRNVTVGADWQPQTPRAALHPHRSLKVNARPTFIFYDRMVVSLRRSKPWYEVCATKRRSPERGEGNERQSESENDLSVDCYCLGQAGA